MGIIKHDLTYTNKPIFGLDIGHSSLKVMQIVPGAKAPTIKGYGYTSFEPGLIEEGMVVRPEAIASVAQELFDKHLVGHISTTHVAASIPAARTFNRVIELPKMNQKDLAEAVRLEAEQYIPISLDELYLGWSIVKNKNKKDMTEVLVTAAPKKIVDSHHDLLRILGLEVVALETTIAASSRLVSQAEPSDIPSVLIDFGSVSTDITIYAKTLVVTGTVLGGGDSFTQSIADTLKVTYPEAHIIKTKYGLGLSKKQKEITAGMDPILEQLLKEVRRMIRYYEERADTEQKIGQVITMGGGANMPGLSEYMTGALRLPVRMCDPWQKMNFGKIQPPNSIEKSLFITVAGLALMRPDEALA